MAKATIKVSLTVESETGSETEAVATVMASLKDKLTNNYPDSLMVFGDPISGDVALIEVERIN